MNEKDIKKEMKRILKKPQRNYFKIEELNNFIGEHKNQITSEDKKILLENLAKMHSNAGEHIIAFNIYQRLGSKSKSYQELSEVIEKKGLIKEYVPSQAYMEAAKGFEKIGYPEKAEKAYSLSKEYTEKHKDKESEQRFLPKPSRLEEALARLAIITLMIVSITSIILLKQTPTGYAIISNTGTVNYPLFIALAFFVMALILIIKNKKS